MEKILIIGTGGRENALGWNISKSNEISGVEYLPEETAFKDVRDFIKERKIALTIIGSEELLAEGIVDFLNFHGISSVFGPTKEMARIESDKFYSYDLMNELGIPQARSIKCNSIREIEQAITKFENSVLKYKRLAKGKGVRLYSSQEEARRDVNSFVNEFGEEVLVSERLYGQEFSVFGIADGKNLLLFEMAFQDHKPLYDGDLGPNTGGMGAYGPVPIAPTELVKKIAEDVMLPIVRRLSYKGFLYAGMILTDEGPKVIEFNARFGDPEAQPAMMMLSDSIYTAIKFSLGGRVSEAPLSFREGASCCVVLASKGYPEKYEKNLPIFGINEAEKIEGVKVFPAGARLENGQWFTYGGRVLGVTAYSGRGIVEAQKLAYEAVSKIKIPGGFHFRRDIASKAINSKLK
ncbi:MAG TPA: phosphoribosylamine--glycine ligase [Candidatus Pacearchaeota archaeon]|nr:phosphoribosylamine--glycine ligase [Candidatus Pacearchaeota archaeon]